MSDIPLRAWASIGLASLSHNLSVLETRYGLDHVMLIAKADAYGHGIDVVAPHAYRRGVRHFGVATTDEGMYLRRLVPSDSAIYVLSAVPPGDAPAIVADQLVAAVSGIDMADALASAAQTAGMVASVHLDVDTGMGRSGFRPSETVAAFDAVAAREALRVSGITTHFASADEDPDDARGQHSLFMSALADLGERCKGLVIHASNTPASLVLGPVGTHSLIRPGLLVYGVDPAPGMFGAAGVDVKPVMSIKARVTLCRDLDPGASISYGRTYHVPPEGGRYATISLGYGDGWPRRLGGGVGSVLLRGKRAPICGRICMDQFVVDVTAIPDVAAGDIATLVGLDGEEEITVSKIASAIAATPHEITTCLTTRLPRIPIQY